MNRLLHLLLSILTVACGSTVPGPYIAGQTDGHDYCSVAHTEANTWSHRYNWLTSLSYVGAVVLGTVATETSGKSTRRYLAASTAVLAYTGTLTSGLSDSAALEAAETNSALGLDDDYQKFKVCLSANSDRIVRRAGRIAPAKESEDSK